MSDGKDYKQQEKGRALVRGLHLSELQTAGAARALALHQADVELDRVARLLPDALQAGISLAEISRVTGVSRPTLYELRARYGGTVGDMRLAVLQALATHGELTPDELADRVGGDDDERSKVLSGLVETAIEVDAGPGDEPVYWITDTGLQLLEHWTFEDLRAEDRADAP